MRIGWQHKLFGIAILPAAVLTIGIVLVQQVLTDTLETARWVTHTHEVIATANALLVDSVDSERALARPGADATSPRVAFAQQADRLEHLVSDNRAQVARARRMREEFARWTADPASTAALASLRVTAAEFVDVERRLLADRTARNARQASATRIACGATISVGFLAGLLLAWRLSRRMGASLASLTNAAEALAAGDDTARARADGADGLAMVARSFNDMAEALVAREKESAALARFGEYLAAATDVGEAVALASTLLADMFPGSTGAIYVSDESRTRISPLATWGPDAAALLPFTPVDCWALRRGRLHDGLAAPAAVGCAHVAGSAHDCLCVPLVAEGDALSMLHLRPRITVGSDARTAAAARRRLVVLLTSVAERLAVSLANLRLKQSLRSQSIRDPLTTLYNRRYLEETLPRELARAQRDGSAVAVIVVDVDHFKRFNDRHGHQAGDAVLRDVGRVIAGNVRTSDVACRYGGEEFVVVLPGATLEQATEKAEALRTAIAQVRVVHGGVELEPVTASFGVASTPPLDRDGPELIRTADEALYAAKRGGRDRVVALAAAPRTKSAA